MSKNTYTFSRLVRDVEYVEIKAESLEEARRILDERRYESYHECHDSQEWEEGDQPTDHAFVLALAAYDLLRKWETGKNLSEEAQALADALQPYSLSTTV